MSPDLQVRILKNNFGFINCCERHEDVIFNFAELADGLTPADIAEGDDVEFTVTGSKPNQSAVRCFTTCAFLLC